MNLTALYLEDSQKKIMLSRKMFFIIGDWGRPETPINLYKCNILPISFGKEKCILPMQ